MFKTECSNFIQKNLWVCAFPSLKYITQEAIDDQESVIPFYTCLFPKLYRHWKTVLRSLYWLSLILP